VHYCPPGPSTSLLDTRRHDDSDGRSLSVTSAGKPGHRRDDGTCGWVRRVRHQRDL